MLASPPHPVWDPTPTPETRGVTLQILTGINHIFRIPKNFLGAIPSANIESRFIAYSVPRITSSANLAVLIEEEGQVHRQVRPNPAATRAHNVVLTVLEELLAADLFRNALARLGGGVVGREELCAVGHIGKVVELLGAGVLRKMMVMCYNLKALIASDGA